MAQKEDMVFYAGYGLVAIMLGLMLLLFSMNIIDAWFAFGFWLLSVGLIMVGLGAARTESAPHGSTTLVGFGMMLAIISGTILAIISDIISPVAAFALFIVLIGIGIVILGVARSRSK